MSRRTPIGALGAMEMEMAAPHTNTWTFANRAEAHATLEMHGYTRLPVAQQPVERWSTQKWDDFGVEYTSFACSAGLLPCGSIAYSITDYGRTDVRPTHS
jgi:hypothetical protein